MKHRDQGLLGIAGSRAGESRQQSGPVREAVPSASRHTAAALLRPEERQRLVVAALALVGVLLVAMIGTSSFTDWEASLESDKGDLLRQLLLGGIFFMLLLGAGPAAAPARQRRGALGWLPLPLSLIILLGYCFLSIGWAVAPFVSLRRFALTAMVIWILFRAVAELGYERTLALLRGTLVFMLVANFVSLLVPGVGLQPDFPGGDPSVVGDWRGLLFHKNLTGAVCAFTILLFLFDRRSPSSYFAVPVILGAAIFLYFSHSKTSEGVLLVALLTGLAFRAYSADYRAFLAPFLIMAAGLLLELASLYFGEFSVLLNDPDALTGRSQIWPILLTYASEHPLTGAGFGSFWQIGDEGPIWDFTSGWIARSAGHGHNGYLDLLVTIGAPGLVLAILVLFVWPVMRLLLSHAIPGSRRALLLSLIAFCAGHNMTETSLLDRASVVQVFLILTIALIYQQSQASPGRHHQLRGRSLRMFGANPGRAVTVPARQPRRR